MVEELPSENLERLGAPLGQLRARAHHPDSQSGGNVARSVRGSTSNQGLRTGTYAVVNGALNPRQIVKERGDERPFILDPA